MTTATKTPKQVLNALEFAQVNGSLAADCRKVLGDECNAVRAALQSGDGAKIAAAVKEANRVATMWGVSL